MTPQNLVGKVVYDPRGALDAENRSIAERVRSLTEDQLHLGVLNNTKWNSGKLLRHTAAFLSEEIEFANVNFYNKEGFSKNADPQLIARIATENDVVLTAIGD